MKYLTKRGVLIIYSINSLSIKKKHMQIQSINNTYSKKIERFITIIRKCFKHKISSHVVHGMIMLHKI